MTTEKWVVLVDDDVVREWPAVTGWALSGPYMHEALALAARLREAGYDAQARA